MAQRIKYSDKTQRRIEKIWKALNGTLEPPAPAIENERMQQKIKIFFS